MAGSSRSKIFGALCGLALAVGANAAEAQQRLTLSGFYSNVVSLSGSTSTNSTAGTGPSALALDVTEQKRWYAIELDARINPTVSINIASTSGRLQETLSLSSSQGSAVVDRRLSTVRHNTLSLLFHPVPGQWVDFYFGPSYGQARFDRAFAASEEERALGGKAGVNLQLGDSRWQIGAQLSVLTSAFHVADGEPRRNVKYTVVGAGLGYRF